ncbi:CYTH domain-containing protein [Bacillus rubiinfantis]|uniref:CYTH domain-containing protein n=1 Tax=Bacillus rubiinfantis TaxID=1499680 RepID=UPI0005A71E21|nr:CYTH domain-containing protein [Bacillus rubiinfantis]
MTENLEIEFKNMLTKEEYELLFKEFAIDETQVFTQENHYFDTVDFSLKNLGSALRIRKKGNQFEMTLKQPVAIGLLETNQLLNETEASQAIQYNRLPEGEIKEILAEKGISYSSLSYFGSLVTNRVERSYKEGLLVLDHSLYLRKEDFELEYEVTDFEIGKERFQHLLKQFGIPERRTENKIQRFYHEKYKQKADKDDNGR